MLNHLVFDCGATGLGLRFVELVPQGLARALGSLDLVLLENYAKNVNAKFACIYECKDHKIVYYLI